MKISKQISIIKSNAIKLRKNSQIPFRLYELIMSISSSTDLDYIKKLKNISTELIRVKGYYLDKIKMDFGNNAVDELLGN